MSETKYWMAIKEGPVVTVFNVMVDAWWGEEFMSGDHNGTKPPVSDKDEKKVKNLESDYGKSVKIIVQIRSLSERLVAFGKLDKDVVIKVEIYRKAGKEDIKIGNATGKIKKTTDVKAMIIIPVYLKKEWCYDDKRWYQYKHKEWYNYKEKRLIGPDITSLKKEIKKLKDELYFKISIGDREEYIPFAKDDGHFLTVWPLPALIMHAEAEIEKFFDGGDIRPIPTVNGWDKNHGYWYRLGRAYSGLGVVGKQIIKYIYTNRKEFESGKIEVSDVKWRGSVGEFEHPTPNIKEASKVEYVPRENPENHFQFYVPGAHEDEIFIHGTLRSEGCFLLGGNSGIPKEGKAQYIWNTMKKLLDNKDKEFENGVIKISSEVTKDKITKLDFNYNQLHKTGIDYNPKKGEKRPDGDRGLTKNEKDYFNRPPACPLTENEIMQFVINHGKRSGKKW